MRILKVGNKDFEKQFEMVISRGNEGLEAVERLVEGILQGVKAKGDEAVLEYTRRFDGTDLSPFQLRVSQEEIEEAHEKVPKEDLDALRLASERIESFHRRQLVNSWFESTADGIVLGQIVTPLRRIGAYIPGGENPYPSTVLMTLIPAKIAGVSELIVASPIYGGRGSDHVLAAARLAGATSIFRVGGAQGGGVGAVVEQAAGAGRARPGRDPPIVRPAGQQADAPAAGIAAEGIASRDPQRVGGGAFEAVSSEGLTC